MSKTMMLSKGYNEKKLRFPILASQKLDGVPVRIEYVDGSWTAKTRQGKDLTSVQHILTELTNIDNTFFNVQHLMFIGELSHRTCTDFKDVSGHVRRDKLCTDLVLNIFEVRDGSNTTHKGMMRIAEELLTSVCTNRIRFIKRQTCMDIKDVQDMMAIAVSLDWEGVIFRPFDSEFVEGKRSWDMMKWKPEPTVDLVVESFEEAIGKSEICAACGNENLEKLEFSDGVICGDSSCGSRLTETAKIPLCMIGRINCYYKGTIIGIGAGKLSHEERKKIFENQDDYIGKIAEVKYMKDNSYEALRQPTFQHWREDKTEESLH